MESETNQSSSLREALDGARPLYFIPQEDVINEVLLPAFLSADSVDCMMGFFTSHSLAEIAPGLASFLKRTKEPMRLVISPYLSLADQEAIQQGLKLADELAEEKFIQELPNADVLAQHTLSCLSWLIREERLIIRIAIMRNALFHPKAWIFSENGQSAALHGSSNMTRDGLRRNREQLTVSRDWKGEEPAFHVNRIKQEFDDLWSGGDETCIVIELPKAIKEKILRDFHSERMPTEKDFHSLWRKAQGLGGGEPGDIEPYKSVFSIPDYLNYRSGEFEHQGQAVDAWKAANWNGVFEMATGSGKTITALIGAYNLHQEIGKILVIIAAPYLPLIEQWCTEVESFGVRAINLTHAKGVVERDRLIKEASRRLRLKLNEVEVLLVSNDTLCTSRFIESVSASNIPKLLIADECHHLGAASFITDPPDCFTYRLGLSATPIRQYDEEGTDALFSYFGEVCFEFTLEDAIGNCLTPYDYHVNFGELTVDEMTEWRELTESILPLVWKIKSGIKDVYLANLLRQRRLVLETATFKLKTLAQLLYGEDLKNLHYTLIYATDKDPSQLEQVNDMLNARGLLFHQLTEKETRSREKTSQILSSFQDGQLQILTAKRVLDEGVNVPQIKKAYILASTTVKRQWVQRRGRLLRTCEEIGKTHSVIHDFVPLPPGCKESEGANLDQDVRRYLRAERDRVWEFARLSRNGATPEGPYDAVQFLQKLTDD